MKYVPERSALEFATPEEVARFHDELTDLLREAMGVAAGAAPDPAAGAEAARAVFKRYASLVRALNVLRRALPRASAPDEGDGSGA